VESVSWDDLERNAASKAGGSSKRHHSWRSHQHDPSRKGIRIKFHYLTKFFELLI